MKLVYTHENRLLVSNAQNLLEQANISTVLKNEYAAGAMGDIAPIDSWMELWVADDKDHSHAMVLINTISANTDEKNWFCPQCSESNNSSFEICWQCHAEAPSR